MKVEKKETFYITTPIYYVNGKPHIGHAYTNIAADVVCRYHQMIGDKVFLLTGTDEHGQKIEKEAKKQGLLTKTFADKNVATFKDLFDKLNIKYNYFIRTTDESHKKYAKLFWQKLVDKGHIYKGLYKGWYSVRDEAFYLESDLTVAKDGKFQTPSGDKAIWLEEESYFFRLSSFQDKLLQFYDQNPNFIQPISRFNEAYSYVKSGLKDLSISRTSFSWGIEVPKDPKHVMYVWLDALTNYLSVFQDEKTPRQDEFWPANFHLVGKDILLFHTVYWPAFLMAASEKLPKQVFAHGWWTNEGQKISKSVGNVIDPLLEIEKYGVDQLRYFLLREIRFGSDGDYSDKAIKKRINSELSNSYGNLCQRTLTLIYNNFNKKIPSAKLELEDKEILEKIKPNLSKVAKNLKHLDFFSALEEINLVIARANQFINEVKPWVTVKSDKTKATKDLYIACELIKIISLYLHPFIPESSSKILKILTAKQANFSFDDVNLELDCTRVLDEPKPIFLRIV